METTHFVPDLVRLQTIATTLSNEAQWAYATNPGDLEELVEAMVLALDGVRNISGRLLLQCPRKYCLVNGSCQPCEVDRRNPAGLRNKIRPRAVVDKSSVAKVRRRPAPRRGGDAPNAR